MLPWAKSNARTAKDDPLTCVASPQVKRATVTISLSKSSDIYSIAGSQVSWELWIRPFILGQKKASLQRSTWILVSCRNGCSFVILKGAAFLWCGTVHVGKNYKSNFISPQFLFDIVTFLGGIPNSKWHLDIVTILPCFHHLGIVIHLESSNFSYQDVWGRLC